MKIACMTEGYKPFLNGAIVSIEVLRQHLEQQGHEVVIFAPAYPGYRDDEPGVRRLPSLKFSRTAYPCLSPMAFAGDGLAGQGFDLVHTHQPFSMARLATRWAARHDLPLVYTFHTMLHEFAVHAGPLAPLASRWLRRTYLRHCAQADWVTTGNIVVRDFLLAEGVRRPLAVVPESVSPLTPTPGARGRLRQKWGLSALTSVLLFVGRLSREKSVDLLLRAVARLPATCPYLLVLAGGGPLEEPLRQQAVRLGLSSRLVFSGWVPRNEIADYYAAADLFVFPSAADAGGIVLIEAMGAGLPCVAVDKYGSHALVIDGETGLLVPYEETAFANAMELLLVDLPLRESMGRAARQTAAGFAPTTTALRMCEIYEQARAAHSRRDAAAVAV